MNPTINPLFNRELGIIQFYNRVLSKTLDPNIPILERLNYLCIVCQNCDELFEVRVAQLQKIYKKNKQQILDDGSTVSQILELIKINISKLSNDIYHIYHQHIIPGLKKEKIYILDSNEWTKAQQTFVYQYFLNELKPLLTPIGIDLTHPFPRIANKTLHFAVALSGTDQFVRHSKMAIVEAPRILPRIIKLPPELSPNGDTFILLQDIIKVHVSEFFYGLKVLGCYPIKVTRASDVVLSNSTKNLRSALTRELHNRQFAQCSRLELDTTGAKPNPKFINILLQQFNISQRDLYFTNGPVNLSRLVDIPNFIKRPNLHFPEYTPGLPANFNQATYDIFNLMDKQDILIHTPYQSFDPVVELTRRAAYDPSVLAIKMTVYRTGADSELVQNLIKAALNGKQVIASIELFARFNEERNVELAHKLEEAGAHVVYGVMGYKVHAKMLLLVRKINNTIKYYTHVGTGNYHQDTAHVYTDLNLLTTNHEIAQDIDNIFAQITGIGRAGVLQMIFEAPFTLYQTLSAKIENEIAVAKKGGTAQIIIKVNALGEPQIINLLYKASQAGVKIKLIVRGSCSLYPGIKGLSDNIEVRSIVGRFLEHHRVYYFYNAGQEDLYMSSADWMKRNFFKRLETCIPIVNPKLKRQVINDCLKLYLRDNVDSWIMQSDGTYRKNTNKYRKFSVQQALMLKMGTIKHV